MEEYIYDVITTLSRIEQEASPLSAVATLTGLSETTSLIVLGVSLSAVLYCLYNLVVVAVSSSTSGKATNGSGTQLAKTKKKRDEVLILGAQSSGKTQLLYKLIAKQDQPTVSSSDINIGYFAHGLYDQSGENKLDVLPSETSLGNSITLVDIPGHFNFRLELQQRLQSASRVVFLIDSKDRDRLSAAAEILYEVLSDVDFAMASAPILIACNKQDLPFAKRAVVIEREMQAEIEQLRKVKKAVREQEQDPQMTGNEGCAETGQTMGYLESFRGKFMFEQLKSPVSLAECSVQRGEIAEILKFVRGSKK